MPYLVFIVSVFAYLLWFQILTVSGATAASSYHFLMPPLGIEKQLCLLNPDIPTTVEPQRAPA